MAHPDHAAARPLGLHERFCLARDNAGQPAVIITAAQLSTRAFGAPLQTHLRQRIAELIERVPLLSATVVDARARVPRWQLGRCTVDEVLEERVSEGPRPSTSLETLLIAEHDRWDAQRLAKPYWRVTLVTAPGSDDAYVVLAINHVICDGRGMANLFEVLLAPALPDLGAVAPLSAPSDEVEKTRPGLLYLLPVVWSDLVLPKLLRTLPSSLARRLDSGRMWPYDATLPAPPHTLPRRLRYSRIDAGSTSALRVLARSTGLRTVQPMVHLASTLACYVVADRQAMRLESTTPMSVRRPERDGLVSGNFVGDWYWGRKLNARTKIWDVGRDYAEGLSSPRARKLGLQTIGMLAYIPDKPAYVPTEAAPTGWEAYLLDKAHSATPARGAVSISNLGLLRLPAAVRSVAWAQSGARLGIDACGLAPLGPEAASQPGAAERAEGIALCTTWREGLVDGDAFVEALEAALDLMVSGELASQQLDFARAAQLIRAHSEKLRCPA